MNVQLLDTMSKPQIEALKRAFTWHAMYSRKLQNRRLTRGVTYEMAKRYRDENLEQAGLAGLLDSPEMR